MITNPFIIFQTKKLFENQKNNIGDKSLVFIKDTNEIYSNNTTYSSFEILENTELSKNTLTPIAKINGQELKLKVESDKMDTTDNITITDIGKINPNYKNQYLEYKTITTQTMAFNGKPIIFGEYFVLVKNSSGGVCSVTIPVVSDTTFICTTNDVKIQPADSILFKIKTYDGLAVVDYEYLYDEPYLLLTKTITSTVYDNREYQAGETIAVLCEVTSVYVNRLSNEEITATAWHDVEVTAPDSSGSVEIEADGAKDSLSVEIESEGVKSYCNGRVLDWTNLTSVSVSDICGSSTSEYFTLKGKGDIYYIRIGGPDWSTQISGLQYKNIKGCYIEISSYNTISIFPISSNFLIDLYFEYNTYNIKILNTEYDKYIKCYTLNGADITPYMVESSYDKAYYIDTILRLHKFTRISENSSESIKSSSYVKFFIKGYDGLGACYFDENTSVKEYENCKFVTETSIKYNDWDASGQVASVIDKSKEFSFDLIGSTGSMIIIEPYELQDLKCTKQSSNMQVDLHLKLVPWGCDIKKSFTTTYQSPYTLFGRTVEVEGEEELPDEYTIVDGHNIETDGDFIYDGLITTTPTYFDVRMTDGAKTIVFDFTGSISYDNPVRYTMIDNNGFRESGTNTYEKIGFYVDGLWDLNYAYATIGFYVDLEGDTAVRMSARLSRGPIDPS